MLIQSSAWATRPRLFPTTSQQQVPRSVGRPHPDQILLGTPHSSRPMTRFSKAWLDKHLFCAYHPQRRNEAAWKKLPGDRQLMAAFHGPMTMASYGLTGP